MSRTSNRNSKRIKRMVEVVQAEAEELKLQIEEQTENKYTLDF